ncbi:unnamed protein product [Linum trigynum]|uniref:Uncharacterized protein n=1 Tax=Linum trigynum TaxID=586398 RepID=A0AAV2C7U5_9ROSI
MGVFDYYIGDNNPLQSHTTDRMIALTGVMAQTEYIWSYHRDLSVYLLLAGSSVTTNGDWAGGFCSNLGNGTTMEA